jgi:hypothetical protein
MRRTVDVDVGIDAGTEDQRQDQRDPPRVIAGHQAGDTPMTHSAAGLVVEGNDLGNDFGIIRESNLDSDATDDSGSAGCHAAHGAVGVEQRTYKSAGGGREQIGGASAIRNGVGRRSSSSPNADSRASWWTVGSSGMRSCMGRSSCCDAANGS